MLAVSVVGFGPYAGLAGNLCTADFDPSEQSIAHLSKSAPDPFALVKDELETVSQRLRRSIFTDIPLLSRAASYFFQVPSAAGSLTYLQPAWPSSVVVAG